MPHDLHNETLHLGLHCLQKSSLRGKALRNYQRNIQMNIVEMMLHEKENE